ncbi:MAG: hypothetical protein ACXAC5_01990 [Promethearchaeota archaeon]
MVIGTRKMTLGQIVEGLQLVATYCENGLQTQYAVEGGHEIVYAKPDQHKKDWSSVDVKKMEELGWFWDEDYETWAMFT